MKAKARIKVRIIKQADYWYKVGDVHSVGNYVSFDFRDGDPHFEKECGVWGINLKHCVVLSEEESLPEHTMEELTEMLGYKFKLRPL